MLSTNDLCVNFKNHILYFVLKHPQNGLLKTKDHPSPRTYNFEGHTIFSPSKTTPTNFQRFGLIPTTFRFCGMDASTLGFTNNGDGLCIKKGPRTT